MHYLTIPKEPIQLVNPDTDLPVDPNGVRLPSVTSQEVFRVLFKDPRITQALDTFSAYDLRASLVGAMPGTTVKLRDEEHEALKVVAMKPTGLSPMFLYSPDGVAFLRAIVNAPTSEPASVA